MLNMDRIALGMLDLIYNAILDHKQRHFGDRPCRIELHPALEFPLMLEIDGKDTGMRMALLDALKPYPELGRVPSLFSVPVRWTREARYPKLITVNDQVEYL